MNINKKLELDKKYDDRKDFNKAMLKTSLIIISGYIIGTLIAKIITG